MNQQIIELAEKSGAFPIGSGADNSLGFRERALEEFVALIVQECCQSLQGFTFEEIAEKAVKNTFGG